MPSSASALHGLRARVVELARLADDDRAGADDEDALDRRVLGHVSLRGAPGGGAARESTNAARSRHAAGSLRVAGLATFAAGRELGRPASRRAGSETGPGRRGPRDRRGLVCAPAAWAGPTLLSEGRFRRHLEAHTDTLAALERGASNRRIDFAFVAALVGCGVAWVGLFLLENGYGDLFPTGQALGALRTIAILQVVPATPVLVFLHVFRGDVRQHEADVLRARLPERAAEERIHEVAESWDKRARADVVVSLAALVPVVGVVAILVAATRATGALEHHEANERAENQPSDPRVA